MSDSIQLYFYLTNFVLKYQSFTCQRKMEQVKTQLYVCNYVCQKPILLWVLMAVGICELDLLPPSGHLPRLFLIFNPVEIRYIKTFLLSPEHSR